jgi:N-methylhydantoinase A/oxoprolinase/acetone carboxylase beta subunit
MEFRISVDTGSTFTDTVVLDEAARLHIGKALTTANRIFEGTASDSLAVDVAATIAKRGALASGRDR